MDHKNHKEVIFKRDFKEYSRLILEWILVAFQFVYHLMILNRYSNKIADFPLKVTQINCILFTLLFVNVTIRLFWNFTNRNELINKTRLWTASFVTYLWLFIGSILPFRSGLIHHLQYSKIVFIYYNLQFVITTLLLILLATSPIKNELPVLYETGDSKMNVDGYYCIPSPEPKTSILQFISWSFFDKFVWLSHLKTIEMKDVWSLSKEDHSLNVLKNFKNFYKNEKKFSKYLILFFSKYLLLQGFWAMFDSIISFMPTVLLQRILEYVSDQKSTPKNVAWFYVFSMFACKMLAAIFSGQALFFGRRVCIRMRSIIISEIYTKALRRKISNSSTSPTKENEEEEEKLKLGKSTNSSKEQQQQQQHEQEEAQLLAADMVAQEIINNGEWTDPQAINDAIDIDADEETIEESANLGAIINLMSVDAFKVSEICAYLHGFVAAIVMTIVALVLLYRLIGMAAIVGAVLIVVMLPINFKLATLLGTYQEKSLGITDKRIQKINETLQSIRIIKFFSWEENFIKEIQDVREQELQMLIKRSVVWALGGLVWYITPSIVTSISFAYYIYVQKEVLTTPIAFTALSLFALLRNPLDQLSDMVSFVIQSAVSLRRIQKFLNEEETQKYQQLTVSQDKLGFDNATISWDAANNDFKLSKLNIDFKLGKLNVVIGSTGSGKTSLLMGLLGEMDLVDGKIYVPNLDPKQDLIIDSKNGLTNSIAYCSQAAWLLNDTVKNNILFNSEFHPIRYQQVIEACGLKRDFEILAAGDLTEIGEKGITLSGGQKQRVSLARALYSTSKHLLLDDCLSAVDSHTALWIYENCITGPLMENRTCVLVSHNIALTLKNAEWVVILENGKVKDQGEPLELLRNGALGNDEFIKTSILTKTTSSINLAAKNAVANATATVATSGKNLDDKHKKEKKGVDLSTLANTDNNDLENGEHKNGPKIDDKAKKELGKLIEEETKSDGVVSIDVYKWYAVVFGGLKIILFLVFVFVIANLSNIIQSWWVRYWAAHNFVAEIINKFSTMSGAYYSSFLMPLKVTYDSSASLSSFLSNDDIVSKTMMNSSSNAISISETTGHSTKYYLLIYFGIGCLAAFISASKTIISFIAGINAARKMFNIVLGNVMYAKLRFFDSTPIGRIMNRFSKDIETVDQDLTPFMESSFISLVQCVSTIILIAFITPSFLFGAFIVCFMYYLLGYFYICGSRELKRFESITRSPIHQHFSETLVGVSTIRAYGDERRFMQENLDKIDENNKPFFYMWVANRWLAFRIDLIGALVILFSGISILVQIDSIDAGLAGISLTYAISFAESALWLVRMYSNVEMAMNSVERLKEYTDIDEEPLNKDGYIPPKEWPEKGNIEVHDLSLRYASNLPRVIKNVTFTVESNSKVGIVGRTGAGKSTIITALFRFLDPETGFIKIDGVDITSIPLKKLRQSITIIPQDPTLFTGTIKTNLDPYDEYNSEEIFESLRRVNLIDAQELDILKKNNFVYPASLLNNIDNDVVANSGEREAEEEGEDINDNVNKFLDLSNKISEGGFNISQGQRQLVCLARALLRSPKVMLLDEATASIDYNSDAKIQETIREEFSNSTILTIAHRLRSIIDYDRILVMDAGEVKEYDHPYSLLLNKESIFYSMCEDSGELETLIQLAKESFVKKLNV
ncbi:hypothetical protein ACO0RG_003655 [Hanseniaspora osmophila]